MAQSRKEVDSEKLHFRMFLIDRGYDLFKRLFTSITWIVLAWIGFLAIDSLAGKITYANISIQGSIQEACDQAISYTGAWILLLSIIVGIFGIVYGRRQASLRKSTVERLTAQITILEKIVDPGRSSSQLTTRGETAERDK